MTQNELYHYGIKRRSGRYPWGSGDRPYQGDSPSKIDRYKLEKSAKRSRSYEQDRTIPKGTKIYQTVDQNGNIYGPNRINYLNIDRDRSKGRKILSKEDERTKVYEREMVLTEDLKVPGRDHLIKSVNEIIQNKPGLLNEAIQKDMEKWMHRSVNDLDKEELSDFYKRLNRQIANISNKSLDDAFIDVCLTFDQENGLKKELIQKLKNEGYNAMADESHIKWKYVEGGDPIMPFDINEVTKSVSQKEVTNRDAKVSDTKYHNWLNKSRTRYLKGK